MTPPKVVLDTNVLISAFLFEGTCSRLLPLWQKGKMAVLITRPILDEYLRVLAYPKFQLTDREIKELIEEDLLPFVEVIGDRRVSVPILNDRSDEKFLRAALLGKAGYLVSGDAEILSLSRIRNTEILPPAAFLELIASSNI